MLRGIDWKQLIGAAIFAGVGTILLWIVFVNK